MHEIYRGVTGARAKVRDVLVDYGAHAYPDELENDFDENRLAEMTDDILKALGESNEKISYHPS